MVDAIKRINKLTQIPGLIPVANMLAEGQIAINMADGKLYIRLLSGSVICVGQDVSTYEAAIEDAIDGLNVESYALASEVATQLAEIAAQIAAVAAGLASKAAAQHTHPITEVAQLGDTLSAMQTAIDGKQPSGSYAAAAHGHPISQVDGLQQVINNLIADLQAKQPAGNYQPAGSYAAAGHGHGISEVTGLQTALDSKASVTGVTGLFTVDNLFTANAIVSNNYVSAGTTYRIGTNNVIRAPNQQGWQNPTGPQSTATFNAASVTLNELSKRVAAIQTQLIYHGILSTQGTTIT